MVHPRTAGAKGRLIIARASSTASPGSAGPRESLGSPKPPEQVPYYGIRAFGRAHRRRRRLSAFSTGCGRRRLPQCTPVMIGSRCNRSTALLQRSRSSSGFEAVPRSESVLSLALWRVASDCQVGSFAGARHAADRARTPSKSGRGERDAARAAIGSPIAGRPGHVPEPPCCRAEPTRLPRAVRQRLGPVSRS